MCLPFKQCLKIYLLFVITMSLYAQENSSSSGRIYIESIQCEGRFETPCMDLIKILGVKPDSYNSEDELSALTSKLKQMDYHSDYSVSLEPLKQAGHANLILKIHEKDTGRHGLLVRGLLGWGSLPSFGQYSYTDTNFLGKGHFFHGNVTANLYKVQDSVRAHQESFFSHLKLQSSFSLELATPISPSYMGSLRLLTPHFGQSQILGLVGVGMSTGYNSAITAYVGNAIGLNFTYTTEDNSFIPTSGVRFSSTYLNSYLQNKEELWGLDAKSNFHLGRWGNHDQVLTLGVVYNPYLNPNFYSFEGQQVNSSPPEGGLTYSLVKTEKNRRSAMYIGLGATSFVRTESNLHFHMGYKAALENIDINLGLIVAREAR